MRDALTAMGQAPDSEAQVEMLTARHAPDCGRGQREPCTCGAGGILFDEFEHSIEKGGDRHESGLAHTKAAKRLMGVKRDGGAADRAAPLCHIPTLAGPCTFRRGHDGSHACGP